MAEDTNKDVAATAVDDGSSVSTDTLLDQAATDAVAEQTVDVSADDAGATDNIMETVSDETGGVDADGLPLEHGKRSDLGRKLSAIHRRQDDFDSHLDRLLTVLEKQQETTTQETTTPEEEMFDSDEPLTYKDMTRILEHRDRTVAKQTETYNQTYVNSLSQLSTEMSDQEQAAILAELKNITYNPSANPAIDAENNFHKAEKIYLRKALALAKSDKTNPIKGNEPRSPLGGITNQGVITKESALPKLDAAGQSYLAFVGREDGNEAATKLHKSVI